MTTRRAYGWVFWVLASIVCLYLWGCGNDTVRPVDKRPVSASYDGNVKDSGLISIGPGGALITGHARDRYNSMIDLYGKDPSFAPPLVHDFGIKPFSGTNTFAPRGEIFEMTREGVALFSKMNRWRRMGKVPVALPK